MKTPLLAMLCAFLLAALPALALDPMIPASKVWIDAPDVMQLVDGMYERYAALRRGARPDEIYPSTNWIWNFNRAVSPYSFRVNTYNFDELLYGKILPYYAAVTNLSVGAFDNADYPAVTNWTYRAMHDYLKQNFTNTDGTVGVGVFTNDTWYWTLTFQTSAWSVCLGSLTYSITNQWSTNATNFYACGWVYQDKDRIVQQVPASSPDLPVEWDAFSFFSANWWYRFPGMFPDANYGTVFDWADTAKMSNTLSVTLGSTNWSTLDTNLSLYVVGRTNYVAPYGHWFGFGSGGLTTNMLDVSAVPTGTVGGLALHYDLGGWISNVEWQDGLVLMPGAILTDLSGPNHLGDTISVNLHSGGRLYSCPTNPLNGSASITAPALQPWLSKPYLNERGAVLALLRVIGNRQSWYTRSWTANFTNNYGGNLVGQSFASWAEAKSRADANYTLATNGGAPHAFSSGSYNGSRWDAGISRAFSYLLVSPTPVLSNVSCRVDYYVCATNAQHGDIFGPFDANGDDVIQGKWSWFSTSTNAAGSTNACISPTAIGSDPNTRATWCAQPVGSTSTNRGWEVLNSAALIYPAFNYCTNDI